MADSYTQLYIHLVFAVKFRKALIHESFREEVEKYMTGLLQNKDHKLLAIYLMPDHAHIFIGLNPVYSISETVKVLKTESTFFINKRRFIPEDFRWQKGYGAFSHSRSALDTVVKYINNQPEIHRQRTFKKEYINFLNKYDIRYDPKYLFDFFD